MQHAALDSILKSLKFTGLPFPAVSLTSNSPDQNKTDAAMCGMFTGGLVACMDRRFVVARRHTMEADRTLFNVSGSSVFSNNKFQIIQRRRYWDSGELLREMRGIWERLWLMLEVERGLEVQL